MNPGVNAVLTVTPESPPQAQRAANSPNHGGEGQNVVYGDTHVAFQPNVFCGVPRVRNSPPGEGGPRDNIYAYGGTPASATSAGIVGPPQHAEDTVLLPTILDGPQPPTRKGAGGAPAAAGGFSVTLVLLIAAIAFAAAAGAVVLIITLRRRGAGRT